MYFRTPVRRNLSRLRKAAKTPSRSITSAAGYSFSYLKHLPVDYPQIDGAFVKDVVDDPIDRTLVAAIDHMGYIVGITTIAEFVEQPAVLAARRELGADYARRYAISAVPVLQNILHEAPVRRSPDPAQRARALRYSASACGSSFSIWAMRLSSKGCVLRNSTGLPPRLSL